MKPVGGVWDYCVQKLEEDLPAQQFNTWIRPLQALENGSDLVLLAPNRFVLDWVRSNFLERVEALVAAQDLYPVTRVMLEIGTRGGR
jgi:chromosomal replication initiator protein